MSTIMGNDKKRGVRATDVAKNTPGSLVGDARFSRLHSDPRFQRLPKNKVKVPVDARFAHALSDKRFRDPVVNERGGAKKSASHGELSRKYYVPSEQQDKEGEEIGDADIDSLRRDDRGELQNSTISERKGQRGKIANVEVLRNSTALKKKGRRKQTTKNEIVVEKDSAALEHGETEDDSSDLGSSRFGLDLATDGSVDESLSSSSSSEDESSAEEEVGGYVEEKVPTTGEETRRLAVVNMDWEHVRSVNLLVLMHSFLPKGGSVRSVTIYPSEFGIQQMEEQNLHGPKSIFGNKDHGEDEDEGPDQEKLREYEKAKLRYFYAVVECDSASTAAHLYQNCDGLEFERSSNTLDLRYIPDEMEFLRSPKDVATEIPLEYKPIDFETRALQHSNVRLTWDDDDSARKKTLMRNFNRIDMNEMDFRDYVASGSSESESEAVHESNRPDLEDGNVRHEKVRSKYLSLLADDDENNSRRGTKAEKGNIEIKFHTGLDELSKKLLSKAKNDKADETVWEKYLNRRKEKKGRKTRRDESDVSGDDFGMDSGEDDLIPGPAGDDPSFDPFFEGSEDENFHRGRGSQSKSETATRDQKVAQGGRRKRKEDDSSRKEGAIREKAELDLLLMDDNAIRGGEEVQNLQNVKQSGKKRKFLRKRAKDQSDDTLERKVSSTDIDDPRFASLFTSHHYSLDPTDPNYSKASSRIAEKQRLRVGSFEGAKERFENNDMRDGKQRLRQGVDERSKAELSSLVRSLQSKVQAKVSKKGKKTQ